MSQVEESTRRGYSSQSYLKLIEDYLPAIWESGMEFMQDNAPIHTANIIKNWFDEHGIPLVDWPPYSPDLNLSRRSTRLMEHPIHGFYLGSYRRE